MIFSDEKKVNLDSLYCYNYSWAGIKTKEVVCSR